MAGAYTITVKAIDNASGTFDTANKAVERLNKQIARARAPFDQLQANFQKFTKITGLGKIATGFQDVAKGATECFRSMLRVIEPLAAITGAASIAGLYKLAQGWASFEQQLGNSAMRAGQTANSLQALQGAARLAGVDTGTLTAGMTTLNDNMRNAAFGGAPKFIQALQLLGLNYDDIKKKSPNEVLGLLADKMTGIKNPTDRALIATAAFGGAAEAMTPFLLKGSKGIADLRDEAERLSRPLGEQGVADARAFAKAQAGLSLATDGLANALGQKLGVALTPLLEQFAQWIATSPEVNQALNQAGIYAKQFAAWLVSIDWAAVGSSIMAIAHDVDAVSQALGGWERVGEGLLVFFAGRFLITMLAPFATIGLALIKLPIDAALAVAKANAALATVGTGKASGGLAGMFRGLLGMAGPLGVAMDAFTGDKSVAQPGDMETRYPWLATLNSLINGTASAPSFFNGGIGRALGFGGSGGTYDTSKPAIPITKDAQKANARDIANVFALGGATSEGQAALLGSGIQESGLNPQSGAGSGHEGMFQWSAARKSAIEAHFHKSLLDMTPTEQARAAAWEIDSKPEYAAVKTAIHGHDLVAANKAVTDIFEAPANAGTPQLAAEETNRLALSRGALAALPSGSAVGAPAAPIGQAGANGKVDMNVKVTGAAQVTSTSTGDVGVKVENRSVAKDGY